VIPLVVPETIVPWIDAGNGVEAEMKETHYIFRVEPSPEGGWTVWFPDLPGASGWAATLQEVGCEAEAVSTIWLESEQRRKQPIPAPSPAVGPFWPQGNTIEIDGSGQVTGVPDAAKYLGVSERRVQALAKERGIGRPFGRYLLFNQADLEALRPGAPGRPRKHVATAAE